MKQPTRSFLYISVFLAVLAVGLHLMNVYVLPPEAPLDAPLDTMWQMIMGAISATLGSLGNDVARVYRARTEAEG